MASQNFARNKAKKSKNSHSSLSTSTRPVSLGWFSPPTSDDSSDETSEIVSPTKDQTKSKIKSCYGKTEVCENIYSKTYKKRQSYERKRDKVAISDASSSKVKPFHQQTQQFGSHIITGVKSRREKAKTSFQPLVIAKQLLEKAKGEKRFQLQKKEVKDTTGSPVSRFGRTVKKKVLDYDDFTGGHRKRKCKDVELPPLKAFKGEEGEWQLIRSGWLNIVYPLQFLVLTFYLLEFTYKYSQVFNLSNLIYR